MIPIQGELFKNIEGTSYFHIHEADFSKAKSNVIILHNSDYPVSHALSLHDNMKIFTENKNIVVFSQNVDIRHERIIALPIGLENSEWFTELKKQEKIMNLNKRPLVKTNFCVAKFNTRTHHSRVSVLKYFSKQEWCDSAFTLNGFNFDEYLNSVGSSTFCICPRGNGIDTHRLWECLYVKTIPIVESCINTDNFYAPIIRVEKFEDVTKEGLEYFLNQLPPQNSQRWFDMFTVATLDFNYWKGLIKENIIEN